jgi:hypothetical protein
MASLIEALSKSFPQEFPINFFIQFLIKWKMILAGNYEENLKKKIVQFPLIGGFQIN